MRLFVLPGIVLCGLAIAGSQAPAAETVAYFKVTGRGRKGQADEFHCREETGAWDILPRRYLRR